MSTTHHPQPLTAFARDVLQGLSGTPRKLSSRYFYDEQGDKLFQQIMRMPEYYLTDCELEIFERRKEDILRAIGLEQFQLLELGAGDGMKTKVLLRHFLESGADFRYQPIDISPNVLMELEESLRAELPALQVKSLPGDYFKVLHELRGGGGQPKVVLFLGANIGNYTREEAVSFLRSVAAELNPGDRLLIGFDLKKDPAVVLDAYNDPAGVTAAFNLNLLRRLNRELGANFELQGFKHWETYNPLSGEAKSYLVSRKDQHVFIKALNRSFHFEAWEAIDVELSKKYSISELESLAEQSGFAVQEHFFDRKGYFVDSLWRR
ncbi:MAG: L-histidine N(alpha)-methyltransferase [Phaeodactylibacter sp.]|nr:L-histidine N(alpha)-methyltransferase [Phaeodactylibacter sp.]MCB9296768.1 L-histidine N(alpha)-methyltransferase [Lewinellaceae bacterium]